MIQFLRNVRAERYSSPRTVLGFFGAVLAILTVFGVGMAGVLAAEDDLQYLVPYVLAFVVAAFVLLVGGVFVVMLVDVTKLQLGEMSGAEYTEHQRMVQGDDTAGETVGLPDIAGREAKRGSTGLTRPELPRPGNET